MLFYSITALINFITSVALGFIVYFKNKEEAVNRAFLLFCLSVAIWSSFYFFLIVFGNTNSVALIFARSLNMAAIFIPITYFHFIAIFLNIYRKQKKFIVLGYLLSIIIFISGFTPLFVRDVEPGVSFPWYQESGITYHIFTFMFFSYIIYSWYLMVKAIRTSIGVTNMQVKYVLIGTLIGFIGGATNFFPTYNVPISPFGNGLVAIYVVFITLAILKYHLFEIRVILTELFVGVMAIILLILPFLMPTDSLKFLTGIIFLLFLFLGYFIIKATYQEINRNNEIKKLADQLKQLNETLEGKVKERTKELEIAKNIAEERAGEVEKRKEDLEKFYSLTVGRELKMAELKKKIKELEGEIKKE